MFEFIRQLLGKRRRKNRRTEPRVLDGAIARLEARGLDVHCRILDVSAVGARLLSPVRLSVGQPLLVHAPARNGYTELPLVVRRVSPRGDVYEVGVEPNHNMPASRFLLYSYSQRCVRRHAEAAAA